MSMRHKKGLSLTLTLVAAGAIALYAIVPGVGKDNKVPGKKLPPVKAATGIMADGRVVPVRSATLSLGTAGHVAEVAVTEGSVVETGQLLIRLTDTRQQAAVAEATAHLQKARLRSTELAKGPRPQDIAARNAALTAAQAQYSRLKQGPDPSATLEAKVALGKADLMLRQLTGVGPAGSGSSSQLSAEELLGKAKSALSAAGSTESAYQISSAISAYRAAKERLATVSKGPAQAQLEAAKADIERAKADLAAVKEAGSKTVLESAQADVAIASASLAQAKAALAETCMRAPFKGTIAAIYTRPGEMASPGSPLVKLGDMSSWLVETENLTEFSIAKVKLGTPAEVSFDAYPGLKLPGKVIKIQSVGENRQGDITYGVTVKLTRTDLRLRWNMTAQVSFDLGSLPPNE